MIYESLRNAKNVITLERPNNYRKLLGNRDYLNLSRNITILLYIFITIDIQTSRKYSHEILSMIYVQKCKKHTRDIYIFMRTMSMQISI